MRTYVTHYFNFEYIGIYLLVSLIGLAVVIGIVLGVYSSVFVAAAIAMYLGVKREDLVKPIKKDEVQEMVP